MALLQYFKRVDGEHPKSKLPDPQGELSLSVPSRAISAANAQVARLVVAEPSSNVDTTARGAYLKMSGEMKAQIGKRAAEHGVLATIRYYATRLPCHLKESTVRTWKNAYLAQLRRLRSEGKDNTTVQELPTKKRGRPLILGEEVEMQVRAYLKALRENGAVVNTAIAIACAEGIIRNKDSNLLAANGGHIALTKSWSRHLLERMGYVKRRASTKAKVDIADFEAVKEQFLFNIRVVVEMEEIPHDLIINWDQTGIHYIPVGSWTMEKEGAKRVEIAAVDDKRQITAVFAATLTGDFLPPQLIYKGTTPRCLPAVPFPQDWHATFSSNHWANEDTMKAYVENILAPYICNKRRLLKLPDDYPALVIFDHFSGQMTDAFFQLLEENNLHRVMIPANCTDRLQPLDISVNKAAKEFLRRNFQDWYARQICEQLDEDAPVTPVDLKLSRVKPIGARWMMDLYDYLKSKPEIIINGFKGAGIVDCLTD